MEDYLSLAARGPVFLKSIGSILQIVGGVLIVIGGITILVTGSIKLKSGKKVDPVHARILGAVAVVLGIILLSVALYPMIK